MRFFPASVEKLIEQFERLPGIGHKTAQRLAFFVLSLPDEEACEFAQAVIDAKNTVIFCPVCHNLTDSEVCSVCASLKRDNSVICVVSEPKDVAAMERTREYNGLYHVLHGTISPMNNISPEHLRIKELLARLNEDIKEVIMATNPDTEGEATAMYISRLIRPFGINVTRLAYGIPVGSHLEFADDATLTRALEGRREM